MKILGTIILIAMMATSCDNSCKKHVDFKFKKGDLVQVKSSRWAKKGTVIGRHVNSDCEAIYEVSQTTWIEGRTMREFYEYELELEGDGIDKDAEKILKIIHSN